MLRKVKSESISLRRVSALSVASSSSDLRPCDGKPKKRIAFVIAHLGSGGAQRVAANAANALVSRGIDIELILLSAAPRLYALDPRIAVRSCPPLLGRAKSELDRPDTGRGEPERPAVQATFVTTIKRRLIGPAFSYLHLIWQALWLRRALTRPRVDAVLSFLTQTSIVTVLATRGLTVRVAISERNDPRLQRHRSRVEVARRFVYKWADVVTANSRGALASLEAWVPREKLAYLPNPLSLPAEGAVAELRGPTVITVARLVSQKAIDVLLRAWARAASALPGWRLAIVGGGPLRGELEKLANELGIGDSVDWLGHQDDPFPYVRAAKLFVLTSRFEGTPNALLEAMSCGLPSVVSDASPGPCELVGTDQSAGLIVPVEDSEATARAIVRLAQDEALRLEFGRVARARASEHDISRAMDTWLKILAIE